ncbi:MAG TPA: hypothetical protein VFV67_09795 [Actinophytocola sp.]|uniref:hypothetical protein n=1 Tax=Actinophytocola sp. TaxID=1872138 RepID=UPI002DBFB41F|nr:hypothetical protein [Actinophytocola sp.]HEU5470932.1 hypothetical protein [Actinophytocola sp.]
MGVVYFQRQDRPGTVPLDTVLGVLRAYADALGESALTQGRTDFRTHEHREPLSPW